MFYRCVAYKSVFDYVTFCISQCDSFLYLIAILYIITVWLINNCYFPIHVLSYFLRQRPGVVLAEVSRVWNSQIKYSYPDIFLRINPITWSLLDAAILHYFDTFILAFIFLLYNFTYKCSFHIIHTGVYMACVWAFIFQKLSNICHFSDHPTHISM